MSIDAVISDLAMELPAASGSPRRPAFVAVGASAHGTTDRLDEIVAEGFGCNRGPARVSEAAGTVLGRQTRRSVPLRHQKLSDEERERQRDLDRSWQWAQETLADPVTRAYLEASIERANASASVTTLTTAEFLALTEPPTE